jgi:hypothetical protein
MPSRDCSDIRSNPRSVEKPILARSTVGALRYAWLRAPPSHRPNLTQTAIRALTHKAPYEGGQSASVPTTFRDRQVGTTQVRLCPPYAFIASMRLVPIRGGAGIDMQRHR